jgi:hypothetical protein
VTAYKVDQYEGGVAPGMEQSVASP